MSEKTIPLQDLAEELERRQPGILTSLLWAQGQPDRFVAILISLGPEFCTHVMLLAAAALAIPADDPTTTPETVLRIASEKHDGDPSWAQVRSDLTRRFVDSRDTQ